MLSGMRSGLRHLASLVHDDHLTRQLYATDASIYQVVPEAVAFPRSPQDSASLLQAAAQEQLNIIPRGAGTGLVGGAIGDGLVIDFARHNDQIRSFDQERQIVRVGPGVVLDQLNRFLRPYGVTFGPDVATSSRATIGGMIGNNSSGARTARHGTTSDHLHSVTVVTLDGKLTRVDHTTPAFPDQTKLLEAQRGKIEPQLQSWRRSPVQKRWPGYALHLWDPGKQGWPAIFCGSEGTLAGFVEAELKVVPLPPRRALGLVYFKTIAEAMEASVTLRNLDPAAVEHVDRMLLDQTKAQRAFRSARDFLDIDHRPCESMLIVEFDHDIEDSLAALTQLNLGYQTKVAVQADEQALVWSLRKAGLSLLTGCKGSAKPTTGIEDAALPPHKLPEYVAQLRKLLKRRKLEACFYGHASAGLLHVRPVLDLHRPDDLVRFRELADDVSALVKEFKGSLAAEHGVGMARSEFMAEQIAPPLLTAMRALKDSFDPQGLMNQEKIFGGSRWAIDRNIRSHGFNDASLPFSPQLRYAAKDESFSAHLSQCNGCGGCRKAVPTMCPTFLATGDESMSTRGRANLIRGALENRGSSSSDLLSSKEITHAITNCLACKACTTECPSNVNLALLKAELLNARYQHESPPWATRLISEIDRLGRWGTLLPGLSNTLQSSRILRRFAEDWFGFTSQRAFPLFATKRFDHWFAQRPSTACPTAPEVILWDDTFTRYHEPEIGRAAVQILEAAGYGVRLVRQRACCGRPAFSQGNLSRARHFGKHNLTQLQASHETPILFLEPSCYSMFIEDYIELGIPDADRIAQRCWLAEDFLFAAHDHPRPLRFQSSQVPVAVHHHCHSKALLPPSRSTAYLPSLNPDGITLDTGCCGMAGAFGAMKATYDLSLQVANPLLNTLQTLPANTRILASGTSCRQQIAHLTESSAQHPIMALAQALASEF